MKTRKSIYPAAFLILILFSFSLASSTAGAQPSPLGRYVVTLRGAAGNNPDQVDSLVREYGLSPVHRYRRVVNGFSAPLSEDLAKRLKQDPRVLTVEPEGETTQIVILNPKMDPDQVARDFGLHPLHVYRRALKGFAARIDAAMLEKLDQEVTTGEKIIQNQRTHVLQRHPFQTHRVHSVGSDGNMKQIITLRPDVDPDEVTRDLGLNPSRSFRHALKGLAMPMDAKTLERLDQDERVVAVEADSEMVLQDQVVPSGVVRMQIPDFPVAHITPKSGGPLGTVVAVLDTGIQLNHPDLNVCNHAGFVGIAPGNPGYDGDDWSGHGTHVAGIIGAKDNGTGVVGVAPGVCLWSVQVVGPGTAAWSNLIAGLEYISQHVGEIDVVNASLGGSPLSASPYTAVHQAVQNIVNQGVVFVAGAGNSFADISGDDLEFGTPDDFIPAAFSEVMAVSAMDPNPTLSDGVTPNPAYDKIWSSSNGSLIPKSPSLVNSLGAGMDLAAPGVNILSTYLNSGYATLTGTSMASAHAAGLVALYVAANGRGHSLQDTIRIRQAIVDHSQAQADWSTHGNTSDPDENPEPLAFPSEAWVPPPHMASPIQTENGMQLNFTSAPGYNYTVLWAPAPQSRSVPSGWNPVGPAVSGSGVDASGNPGVTTVIDPDVTPSERFYLVLRASP